MFRLGVKWVNCGFRRSWKGVLGSPSQQRSVWQGWSWRKVSSCFSIWNCCRLVWFLGLRYFGFRSDVGEENEEGDSGEREDLIRRVVAGTKLRRWKHDLQFSSLFLCLWARDLLLLLLIYSVETFIYLCYSCDVLLLENQQASCSSSAIWQILVYIWFRFYHF